MHHYIVGQRAHMGNSKYDPLPDSLQLPSLVSFFFWAALRPVQHTSTTTSNRGLCLNSTGLAAPRLAPSQSVPLSSQTSLYKMQKGLHYPVVRPSVKDPYCLVSSDCRCIPHYGQVSFRPALKHTVFTPRLSRRATV